MATIEMKLTVRDVKLVIKADWPMPIDKAGEHITVKSIRLDQADSDILQLLEGATLDHIERAVRWWGGAETLFPILTPPRQGVTP
ncbi:MAG: hypothetical protein WC683_07795 [bacterium]|jgi:hypothetical protein